jgi:hypothetical protein
MEPAAASGRCAKPRSPPRVMALGLHRLLSLVLREYAQKQLLDTCYRLLNIRAEQLYKPDKLD